MDLKIAADVERGCVGLGVPDVDVGGSALEEEPWIDGYFAEAESLLEPSRRAGRFGVCLPAEEIEQGFRPRSPIEPGSEGVRGGVGPSQVWVLWPLMTSMFYILEVL